MRMNSLLKYTAHNYLQIKALNEVIGKIDYHYRVSYHSIKNSILWVENINCVLIIKKNRF